MAEVVLVNRTRFTSSLKNELLDQFDQLAKETRIPKSRLFDEAIEDLLRNMRQRTSDDGGNRQFQPVFPFFPCMSGDMC